MYITFTHEDQVNLTIFLSVINAEFKKLELLT